MGTYICDKCGEMLRDSEHPPSETPRWLKPESGMICDDCEDDINEGIMNHALLRRESSHE